MEFGLLALGFAGMEIFSWAFHKYIMHGVLWSIHKTHHQKNEGSFELNDVFSIFFGSVAVVLIILGLEKMDYRFWIGCGITLYGFVYFILHDILIHRRMRKWKRPAGYYLNALTRAHRDHHKTDKRDGSVSFGLLWVPRRYFRK
uniref:Sterol desaturase family protein n=1 Tax=Roseihalotalea indica TaxID=2867963 RepID=A0AA49GRA9_9BACT|nr:sterol desaturase family protein [Tunicatimonas sp. TK19036]